MTQFIVFDIGNTNVTIGVFEDSKIVLRARLASDICRTADEYEIQVAQLLERHGIEISAKPRVVVATVVPALRSVFEEIVQKLFKVDYINVGPDTCAGILLNVPHPESVGADRIANAVAAGALYSRPSLVVDFGTATTLDVISLSGAFEGGIIAAGPQTSLHALVQRTAKLPKIDLVWPAQVLGKTTEAAMQSGLVIGYASLIDGLIEKLQAELGNLGKIIATGGLGNFFSKHSKYISIYDPDLTLTGLQKIGAAIDES